jgi:hypothetical protein
MQNATNSEAGDNARLRAQNWQALRSLLADERIVQLQFSIAKSDRWLVARFRGIPCYLPRREVAALPEQGYFELSVKVVSTSRQSRSAVVSVRTSAPLAELQQEDARRRSLAASRKAAMAKQAGAEKSAWAEFNQLKEGQAVVATVLRSICPRAKREKAQPLYFVSLGEHLVGAVRAENLPLVDGKNRRVLAQGERVELKVQRKYQKVEQSTMKSTPKVDLVWCE